MRAVKIVIIVVISFLLVLSTPYSGAVPAAENGRNIQIIVEMRQASFNSHGGYEITSQSSQTQFIVVTEGSEGRIFVGEKVPLISYYHDYLMREGYIASSVTLLDVGTSLIVTARVSAGEIEVTLTPEISYATQDGTKNIAVQKMSTTVRVPAGRPIEIGGNVSTSEFNSNFYRSRSGQALQIVLTPKIL